MRLPLSFFECFEQGASFVLLVSILGMVWGLRSGESRANSRPSLWISTACGSMSLIASGELRWVACGVCILSAVVYSLQHDTKSKDQISAPSSSLITLLSVVGLSAITFLLLLRLSRNFDIPLVWEGTVISSFLPEVQDLSIRDAFGMRLLWSEGLLSEGDYSLLFGFPTAILLSLSGTLFSLRIVSVLAFLGSALLLGAACKRFMNPTIGVAALLVFGLNEVGLIFGRYGSSIAATLFSVTAALLCCAQCVSRPTVPRALLALFTLYLATLGYAPGRLVVLLLLCTTTLGILFNQAITRKNRLVVTGILCIGVLVVAIIQDRFGRASSFVSAREEQFFKLFDSGFWPDAMLPQWQAFLSEGRPPTLSDYARFAWPLIVTTTGPQFLEIMSPFTKADRLFRKFYSDPLHQELYASCLFPFFLLGALLSHRRCPRWWFWTLIVWLGVASVPVLLTNRVDSYRTCMLLIPIAIYIAIGFAEMFAEARRSGFPSLLLGILVCGAVASTASSRIGSLSHRSASRTLTDHLIEELEPRFIHQAIVAVEEQEFRGRAQTELLLLRRGQIGLPAPAEVLSADEYRSLVSAYLGDSDTDKKTVAKLRRTLDSGAPVIIDRYLVSRRLLSELGDENLRTYPSPVVGERALILLQQQVSPSF